MQFLNIFDTPSETVSVHVFLACTGSRAFTNVTSGLAKLNPMSNLRLKRPTSVTGHQPSAKFYLQVSWRDEVNLLFLLSFLPEGQESR